MAPRTSWKGFLKLSLVSVPVKAFTANNSAEEIHLNQLHAECNGRVRYLKVCPEHGELKGDDIVSGYEYTKDQYVVLADDELSRLRTQSDKSIAINGFIKPEDGSSDVFVHISAVQDAGLKTLVEGQRLQYDVGAGRNGKNAAANLKILP